MERDNTPAGQEGGHEIPPQLLEALAGLDPGALQAVTEVIVLHREFPAWAVWPPQRSRPWIAVRVASARVPGAGLPLIWVQAVTAAGLADRLRGADAQLALP
ncbi:MAG TPA: hypothetical protein VHZ03_07120 [Trebonia sp.]|nr:hypothetical protein [Trebonia sp.]